MEREKSEECHYMTRFVTAKVTHPTVKKDAAGVMADANGYLIVPGEMSLFMTNSSAENVKCVVCNGGLVASDGKFVTLQLYEGKSGLGRISEWSTWWGGYGSNDSIRYSCSLPTDPGTCNYNSLGLK